MAYRVRAVWLVIAVGLCECTFANLLECCGQGDGGQALEVSAHAVVAEFCCGLRHYEAFEHRHVVEHVVAHDVGLRIVAVRAALRCRAVVCHVVDVVGFAAVDDVCFAKVEVLQACQVAVHVFDVGAVDGTCYLQAHHVACLSDFFNFLLQLSASRRCYVEVHCQSEGDDAVAAGKLVCLVSIDVCCGDVEHNLAGEVRGVCEGNVCSQYGQLAQVVDVSQGIGARNCLQRSRQGEFQERVTVVEDVRAAQRFELRIFEVDAAQCVAVFKRFGVYCLDASSERDCLQFVATVETSVWDRR